MVVKMYVYVCLIWCIEIVYIYVVFINVFLGIFCFVDGF